MKTSAHTLFLPLIITALFTSGCTQIHTAKHNPNATKINKAIPEQISNTPTHNVVANPHFARIAKQKTKASKDRAAILAMQGEYHVDFDFHETVVLTPDYEKFKPKNASAKEVVIVVEDTPTKIVMQHLLVMGNGHVIKHWRQDWAFEATERFEFTQDQYWAIKPIKQENQAGAWTQCVFEVSDAPRYCGTAKWNHRYGVSTWTSDRSWRPLPRREYTIRTDYNALNVENRHTVTPSGWTHEQDNTKVKRIGEKTEKTLVREFGFNNYKNITGYDFTPAYTYWDATQNYWATIRSTWDNYFTHQKHVSINTPVDGMPIIGATFKLAENVKKTAKNPTKKEVKIVLDQWVNVKKTSFK